MLSANGDDGLFEPFAQVLIRLVSLVQFFVFAPPCCALGRILSSEQEQLFFSCHAATLANWPRFRNCVALLNSYVKDFG